jgi:hypothetical protein
MNVPLARLGKIAPPLSICLLLVLGLVGCWTRPAPIPEREEGATVRTGAKEDKPDAPQKSGGRYRLEPLEEAQKPFSAAARLGFLGIPCRELLVFKYQGGYLECRVQIGKDKDKTDIQTIPSNWAPLLGRTPSGAEEDEIREGYLIVAVLENAPTAEFAIQPYLPHLAGLLAMGPGGAPSVVPWPVVSCNHLRELRVFLSARSPQGKPGEFTVSAPVQPIFFQTLFGPSPGDLTIRQVGKGNNLSAGTPFPVVEWEWEHSELSLVGRFLTADDLKKHQGGGKSR